MLTSNGQVSVLTVTQLRLDIIAEFLCETLFSRLRLYSLLVLSSTPQVIPSQCASCFLLLTLSFKHWTAHSSASWALAYALSPPRLFHLVLLYQYHSETDHSKLLQPYLLNSRLDITTVCLTGN